MTLEPGDSVIIDINLNKLYKTSRWLFVTDKKDGQGNFLAVGKQFDTYYSSGETKKKDLALYIVMPQSVAYKESNYKLEKEDRRSIITEILESKEIEKTL